MAMQKKPEQKDKDRNALAAELAEQVQSKQIKDYISKRIIPQMQWYSRKGGEYKQKYYHWTAMTILMSATIPIASVFADGTAWGKVVIAALGAAVTASHSFLVLYNYKDLWQTYQKIHEALLHILYCYFSNAGVFAGDASQAEKDLLFVNTCEEKLADETKSVPAASEK